MHDETTIEAVRWRMVRELEKSRDAAHETLVRARWGHERAEELRERAEAAIREKNREEVAEWARGVLEDERTVVLALATTGLDDPIDIVEVVALDRAGETVFSERVRPTVAVEAGATRMHGHTAASLADAPTCAELYPRLVEVLGGKWVILYNAEYFEGVLAQTLDRYDLEPLKIGVECAMERYCRIEGTWSLESETYSPVKLPNADGTPEGNARALFRLLQDLAGERTPVASVSGGTSRGGAEEVDINEEDFSDIPFRSVFPVAVRYPLVF